MRNLDWHELLETIATFATSLKAKLKITNIQPLENQEEALKKLDQIYLTSQLLEYHQTRPHFESLDLFDSWYVRLKKGATLKPIELKDIRHFILEFIAVNVITESLNCEDQEKLQISMNQFNALPLVAAIDQLITNSGDIRVDASEKLYQLSKEKEALSARIHNLMDKLIKDFDIQEYLQDRYVTTREGRWVIPVKSGRQHALSGVIHGASQTKQTVYLEPESTIPLNNRLREIEVEIEEEIERLLVQISKYLFDFHSLLLKAHDQMLYFDILFSIAQFSKKIDGHRFKWSQNYIKLENIRHPLMVFNGKNPIPNTVELKGNKKILLLSGPNAGGKTVLMKSIGLACHMARCGLPVCALNSEIPFFKNILVGIGDSQAVNQELSTFAAHLRLLNEASQLKGSDQLILIDEIASSTDPEEGGALGRAFIEAFANNDVFAVITSHLSQLKSGWSLEEKILPGSLEFDLKNGIPTYHFIPGIAGQSLALEFAKKTGVNSKIIERAYELLSPETKMRLKLLNESESIKSEIIEIQEGLKKAREQALLEKQLLEQKIQQFNKEKEVELEKIITHAKKQVDQILAEFRAIESFDRHRKAQEIKAQLPEIIRSHGSIKSPLSNPSKEVTKENFKIHFPCGTKVFIRNMNREGIIQSEPNSKGEVLVLIDSMRFSIPWLEIEKSHVSKNVTKNILKTKGILVEHEDEILNVDLRGLTVEQALERVDEVIDRALLHRRSRLKIIHGYGTESLKKALRAHLTRSPFVQKWTMGKSEEGGDGITWVEMNLD